MKTLKNLLSRLPVTFTSQALVYPVFLIAALIFAQLYDSPVSHAIFLFVLALPGVSVIYLIAARLTVHTALRVSEKTPEKREFIAVNALISCRGPFAFPFVEAVMSVPDDRGFVLCDKASVLSLLPFSQTLVSHSVFFALRGEYDICLSHIYVYDLSRCIRLRINANKHQSIFVMPRKINLPADSHKSGGKENARIGSEYQKNSLTEPADIRPYAEGDSPKHIHWKLSSKSEELIVREYTDNSFAGVNIICDLEARFYNLNTAPEMRPVPELKDVADLMLCESAVECTLAAVNAALECGNTVFLSWISDSTPTTVKLDSELSFSGIYRRFAAQMPNVEPNHVKRILDSKDFSTELPTVVITPYIDKTSAESYKALFTQNSPLSRTQIFYCEPKDLYDFDARAEKFMDDTLAAFAGARIRVTHICI